jgi:hypothetical protein
VDCFFVTIIDRQERFRSATLVALPGVISQKHIQVTLTAVEAFSVERLGYLLLMP